MKKDTSSSPEKKKSVLRLTGRFILICLVCILPLLIPPVMTAALPPCYDEAFEAELAAKYERLVSLEEPKIIVVGGSSVAFGLDSALLEEYTGMPTVNFGLYAALGTKLMLDLSRKNIRSGDIVILSPEMNSQTLSLYFNGQETLRALDSDWSMFLSVRADNYSDLAREWYGFAVDKWKYFSRDTKPEVSGVYVRSSFNELGDICYPRPQNTKKRGYDNSNPIVLDASVFDPEFLSYLKDYIDFCERKGAEVYFAYPPMNRLAVTAETAGEDRIDAFDAFVREHIPCPVISDIRNCLMDPELFFDSNFHLNDRGVPVRTARLALDLEQAGAGIVRIPEEIIGKE